MKFDVLRIEALLLCAVFVFVRAVTVGGFEDGGNTQVSAMMVSGRTWCSYPET